LSGIEVSRVLNLVQSVNSLAAHVELRQVLGVSIGDGPIMVLWLEGNGFLLSFFLFGWWLISSLIIAIISDSFDWRWWGLWEFFINNLILSDEFRLKLELKADDGSNFSNDLFNAEKFVHESQLKLVIELGKFL
jgi:hypothetical protein